MLYVKLKGENGEQCIAYPTPIYVRRQSNGVIVSCLPGKKAQGIVSPDGAEIWQLAGRDSLGDGYAVVWEITMAEYEEWYALQTQPELPDPEDTDPVIPEGTDPTTVLTRAELTVKVSELDEALNLLLSGVTEDE